MRRRDLGLEAENVGLVSYLGLVSLKNSPNYIKQSQDQFVSLDLAHLFCSDEKGDPRHKTRSYSFQKHALPVSQNVGTADFVGIHLFLFVF